MKRTNQGVIFILTLIIVLFVPAFLVNAEQTLQNQGKLRFKQERIGESDVLTGQEAPANIETELEKVAPDLFEESTKETIEKKQNQKSEQQTELERNLFLQPHEENVVLKKTEAYLFANDYEAPTFASQGQNEQNQADPTSTPILASLIGVALAICGGIYAFMRKMFE